MFLSTCRAERVKRRMLSAFFLNLRILPKLPSLVPFRMMQMQIAIKPYPLAWFNAIERLWKLWHKETGSFNLPPKIKYLTPGVTSIPNQIGQGLAVRSVVLVLVRADGVVVRRKSESPSRSSQILHLEVISIHLSHQPPLKVVWKFNSFNIVDVKTFRNGWWLKWTLITSTWRIWP